MRDTEIQDPLLRLHSVAIAAAREPKAPASKPWPKCTAVWAESFAKVMGEGVAGRPDAQPAPVVPTSNAPHRPLHVGVDLSHLVDAMAYTFVAYMGGRGGGKMHQTAKVLRELSQGKGDCMVGVKLKPGAFVAVNEAGDGFFGIDKHKAKLASESIQQLLNPPSHKPALVASPYPPRKPGEFFPGDRVCHIRSETGLKELVLVSKQGAHHWVASCGNFTTVVHSTRIRLLDEQPDVS